MRYTTTLALAVVVLVAAVLIYLHMDDLTGGKKPAEKPAGNMALVEDLAVDDLAAARLEAPGPDGAMKAKMALAKKDGKWRLSEPMDAATDDYEVGRLLQAAVEGKYRQSLKPGAAGQPDLKALGLDPPAYRLTLTAKAKDDKPARTVTVDVGRKAAFGEGLYARLSGAEKVVVLERADLLERAGERLDKYRSRDLVTLVRDDVVRIEIQGEKGTCRIDRAEDNKDRWVLAQPAAARADTEVVSAALGAALGLTATDFVDDAAADLGRYGLDKPRLVVTLYKPGKPPEKPKDEKAKDQKADDEKKEAEKPAVKPEPQPAVVLRFGAWADLKKESVYLALGDSKAVVSVPNEAYGHLNKAPADLRDKRVLAIEKDRVTQVALRVPAKLAEKEADVAYDLVKADGQWKVKVEGRPEAKADAERVDALLKELADLKVIYFAEGENADVAKGFAARGSVRIQMAKDSAATGFEIGGPSGDVPALVKNIREDWVGRINNKDLKQLRQDWLDLLDKQVFSLDARKATRLAIRTADRTAVFEKTGETWALTAPVKEEARPGFAADRLDDLKDLKATKFVAATKDFKKYNLDPGEVEVAATLAPEKAGEKPVEKTLRLAHHEKSAILGRAGDGDIVFEVPLALFKDLAGEPLPKGLTSVAAADVTGFDIVAGDARVALVKVDKKWFRADAAGRPDEEVDTAKADDVVRSAAGLDAVRWAAYDAKDPAAFGLDKPAVRITMTTPKGKTTLLVSEKAVSAETAALFDEDPLRYAMTDGGKRIAILSGEPLRKLLGAAKDLSPAMPQAPKDTPKKEEAQPAQKK